MLKLNKMILEKKNNNILDLKQKFIGVTEGFNFLDSSLILFNQLKNEKNKNLLKIYNYKTLKNFNIEVDYEKFYDFMQEFYIDFLIKVKFQKYNWYSIFCSKIYNLFAKDIKNPDILSDLVIKILTKSFLCLSNFDNKVDVELLKKHIIMQFFSMTQNEKESYNYTNNIINYLILEKSFNLLNNQYIAFNDSYIFIDFYITSSNLVNFFSKEKSDILYNCNYAYNKLPIVIDNYLLNLINNDSFIKTQELFSLDPRHKECLAFLMNYEDVDFLKIPKLEPPFDELFRAFLFKKLLLNEYCFQTIIMSCYEYYVFNANTRNILMEKADFRFGFNVVEDIHIFIR